MTFSQYAVALAAACNMVSAFGQAQSQQSADTLSSYLVDLSAGSVSARGIVGLSSSAITNVQTSQDLVLAINPVSSKTSKNGYGISITPARTSIAPMSGKAYVDSPVMRLIGSATLSYAENMSAISTISYRKTGLSLDTSYYLHEEDDPVFIGYAAFVSDKCKSARVAHINLAIEAAAKNPPDDATFKREMALATTADKQCVNDHIKSNTKWNADKVSLSYGAGWIKPDAASGAQQSLGRTLAANAILGVGTSSAINVALNRTVNAIDLTTLAKSPDFKDSNLVAIRFSNNSATDGSLLWLVEGSTVKSSTVTVASNAFKYALGVDKKIYPGVWLEFRLGRNYTADSTSTQTTSLLSLNFSPSSTLFGK